MAWFRCRPQVLTLVAVVVSPMITMFYAFYMEHQDTFCHAISRSDKHLQAISYYCNFIDIPASGREGDVQSTKLKLEQVQIIIRHGDRTGVHKLPNYTPPQLSCRFLNYPHVFTHTPHLANMVERLDQNSNFKQQIPSSLHGFSLYPQQDLCEPGQLTPTGVAQQVKSGVYLREKYAKWDLFADETSNKLVKLVTTKTERTFQSGISFLYGILPDFNLSKIEVQVAINQSMCSPESKRSKYGCTCKSVEGYHGTMSNVYGLDFTPTRRENAYYEQIATAFGVEKEMIPSTQSLMDVGMVHMCHRLPLPGSPKKCMEVTSLRHIVEEANKQGKVHSKRGLYPNIAKSRMLPLLDQIYTSMLDIMNGKETPKIVVYAGHDTTLSPLLIAINLRDGQWPMYAARLNIELYSYRDEPTAKKSYFFRILYNGQDMTADAVNCKSLIKFGLCPVHVLGKYLYTIGDASLCSKSVKPAVG